MRTTIIFCTLPFVACLAPAADPPPASATTDESDPSTSTTAITSTDPSTGAPTSTSLTASTTITPPLTSTETITDPSSSSIPDTTSAIPYCGDNHLDPDEECDLGSDNGDHSECTLICKNARCGDGLLYEKNEQCDDANSENTDTCTNECKYAICGDTFVQIALGEECEDGNNNSNDTCTNQCKWAVCGDGITQTGVEPCDDGDADQTDECLIGCTLASCGDGFVKADEEACDDNNVTDGDGCTADCTAEERLVFVTSKGYNGRLQAYNQAPHPTLHGLVLADARCQEHAKDNLPGTYKAWLSTKNTSAKDRLESEFKGVYRLPTPEYPIVAIGLNGLISGMLMHEININELGNTINNNEIWTSTTQNGLSMSDNCNEWTSNDNKDIAYYGLSGATDKSWTNNMSQACNNFNRIYCFQISP